MIFFARGNGKMNKYDRELQAETKGYRGEHINTLFGFLEIFRLNNCLNFQSIFGNISKIWQHVKRFESLTSPNK